MYRYLTTVLLAVIISLCGMYQNANAIELKTYNYTVGCINLDNYSDVQKPKNTTLQGCDYGKKWMRIMTPTQSQWNSIVKTFGSKERAINMLPILNSESQFNHRSRGKNKWGWDCGILQIRDIYGGCKMSEQDQLKWLKTRTDSQKTTTGTCQRWLGNEERMIRCIYNRHNGRIKAFNSYDNKLMAQRKYYKSLYQ